MIADVPAEAVGAFQEYERRVLPLLPGHRGRLERRLRSGDGLSEVHVISFDSREAYEAYLADPVRAGHRPLIESAGVVQRLLEVMDV
jgi:hypothetical protein